MIINFVELALQFMVMFNFKHDEIFEHASKTFPPFINLLQFIYLTKKSYFWLFLCVMQVHKMPFFLK